jgi:urease accessory protein
MEIVRHSLPSTPTAGKVVPLAVDRLTLARRRWRGTAEDGREFGFDLEHPLHHAEAFFLDADRVYQIQQQAEPVLRVSLETSRSAAARLGWLVGNLHFQIEVGDEALYAPDDSAIRQMLDREHVAFTPESRVFTPLGGGHSHGHGHDH